MLVLVVSHETHGVNGGAEPLQRGRCVPEVHVQRVNRREPSERSGEVDAVDVALPRAHEHVDEQVTLAAPVRKRRHRGVHGHFLERHAPRALELPQQV